MTIRALPGGANFAITTTAVAFDCRELAGGDITLVCNEQDFQFCFSDDASADLTLITGASPASRVSLIADQVGATVKVQRFLSQGCSRLVVKTVAATGTLRIKQA